MTARPDCAKPSSLPVGVPAPMCNCHRGWTCDVSHDPAACSCAQCTAGEKKVHASDKETT